MAIADQPPNVRGAVWAGITAIAVLAVLLTCNVPYDFLPGQFQFNPFVGIVFAAVAWFGWWGILGSFLGYVIFLGYAVGSLWVFGTNGFLWAAFDVLSDAVLLWLLARRGFIPGRSPVGAAVVPLIAAAIVRMGPFLSALLSDNQTLRFVMLMNEGLWVLEAALLIRFVTPLLLRFRIMPATYPAWAGLNHPMPPLPRWVGQAAKRDQILAVAIIAGAVLIALVEWRFYRWLTVPAFLRR